MGLALTKSPIPLRYRCRQWMLAPLDKHRAIILLENLQCTPMLRLVENDNLPVLHPRSHTVQRPPLHGSF